MPYAVTCRSCGARFSVADDLVHKKLAGKLMVLRCKRCHEPIRVNASEPPGPPGRRSSHPPAPGARSPLPQGPARPRPRPPLKTRATPSSAPVGHHRRKPPPRSAGRDPNRDERAKGGISHDLFDAPPPSSGRYVDLSDLAHSEPPGPVSSPPNLNSSTPPLLELAHADNPDLTRPADDADFLLGLTGSRGTAAALASPSLADLARSAPSEPPPSGAQSPQPLASKATAAAPPAAAKKGASLGLVLGLAGAIGVAALGFALTRVEPGNAESPLSTSTNASEPDLKPVASDPALEPAAALPTIASAEPAATPASPEPSAQAPSAPTPNVARVTRSANTTADADAKAANSDASKPSAASADVAKASILPKPEPAAAGTAFDRSAAAGALASAAAQASACRKDSDPSGVANVTVTFAPSGRVTAAKLSGPPFAGTATGGCIANTLRRAKIPAFDGDMVTVGKTIVVQ